jgi:WD40 repeat protein
VTASGDKTARLWDAATGKELARLAHENSVAAASFSPDGAKIVTASDDTRLWDAATGKELARFADGGFLAFSPDGAKIVTASGNTAQLWDAATGAALARLPHEGLVAAAFFSPDGARIVTASRDRTAIDKTARVWDAATGKELARLTHEYRVHTAALSPDVSGGHLRIVTASENNAFLWQVEATTDRLVQTAKSHLPRCLTQEQRAQHFLPKAPPIWCITGPGLEAEKDPAKWQPKWPYQSAAWRDWLAARQRRENPPVPASESGSEP